MDIKSGKWHLLSVSILIFVIMDVNISTRMAARAAKISVVLDRFGMLEKACLLADSWELLGLLHFWKLSHHNI